MFIVSGLYCSQHFQNIIPYYTHVYRKLMVAYETGMGLKGTGTLGCVCGHSGTWGHQVWDMWDKGQGTSNTGMRGTPGYEWSLQKSEVNARSTVAHRDKHFPESKTLPRNEKRSQSPKFIPESKNMSQDPKHFPERKNTSYNTKHVPESKIVLDRFWDVFGLWEVFLNSRKCFEFWEVFCPYEPPQISVTFLVNMFWWSSPPYPPYGFSVFTVFNAGSLHHVNHHGGFPR